MTGQGGHGQPRRRSETGLAELVAGLRVWIKDHDPHVRAAVELLIAHDVWLRRPEFRRTCVQPAYGGREHWISWSAACELFDAGEFANASTTERAVLDFAIALGEDRYYFGAMGMANTRLLVAATARALGVAR